MSDPIDGLVNDARVVIERDAAAIPRDFAAVLARVGVEAAAPDQSGNVLALPSRAREADAPGDRTLDGLVGDARASIDRMVAQRRMRAIPELAITRPVPRRRGAIVAGVALLAAAAVLVLGGLQWVEHRTREDVDAAGEQAFRSQVDSPLDGIAKEVEPPVRPRAPAIAPAPAPAPAPAIATPDAAPERSVVRPSVDRLRELAEEAHRLWRAGDRAGAEAKFERIVKLGGRSSAAELAYGDLFALARQLHDAGKQRARWRAYVKRFPKGRFADDARAGLCRAGGDASCWRDYLRDFPRGSYRSEAVSAAGQGDP